jgi:hypothetical protein
MVFRENFVAVVKCGGKIMRESDGCVFLPFGSEYSILLKNKESRRAVVDVEIDGQDVLSGKQLVVEPNSETELKGFLGGRTAKNAFKFIQKTQEIADYGGDRVDDGMVRVSFRFEKPVAEHIRHIYKDYYHYPRAYWWHDYISEYNSPPTQWSYTSSLTNNASIGASAMFTASIGSCLRSAEPKKDEGITVKGSEVNQGFRDVFTKELEENAQVIVIRLKGEFQGGAYVQEPVTVKTSYKCSTCGRESKSSAKFCANCGTALM